MSGEKYLTDTCVFQCSQCEGNNEFVVSSYSNVKINNYGVLTNSAILRPKVPGPLTMCKLLNNPSGTPQYLPCNFPKGKWSECSKNSNLRCNLLTEKSSMCCMSVPSGGKLTVKSCDGNVVCGSSTVPVLNFGGVVTGNSQNVQSNQVKNSDANGSTENGKGADKTEKKEEPQEPDADNMKCPYSKEKEKCKTCEYAHAHENCIDSSVDGNSMVLRQNYKEHFGELSETRKSYVVQFDSYDSEIKIFEKADCGNEAHHIISTNDVLMNRQFSEQFTAVRKLFNYYKMDINDSRNCILLSSAKQQSGMGVLTPLKKAEFANSGMVLTGRQWHKGGHSYSKKSDGMDEILNHKQFEDDYATLVSAMLRDRMSELSEDECRKDNYEKGKKEFEEKFYSVVNEVREKLIKFERNPRLSDPLYVSKVAFAFAYAIPNRVTFIILRDSEKGILATKFVGFRANIGRIRSSLYDYVGWSIGRDDLASCTLEYEKQDEKRFNCKGDEKSFIWFLGGAVVVLANRGIKENEFLQMIHVPNMEVQEIEMGDLVADEYMKLHGEEVAVRLMGKEDDNILVRGKNLWEALGLDE